MYSPYITSLYYEYLIFDPSEEMMKRAGRALTSEICSLARLEFSVVITKQVGGLLNPVCMCVTFLFILKHIHFAMNVIYMFIPKIQIYQIFGPLYVIHLKPLCSVVSVSAVSIKYECFRVPGACQALLVCPLTLGVATERSLLVSQRTVWTGWVSECFANGWLDGRIHACMDGWMDAWMHGCMDGLMDGWNLLVLMQECQ